MAAPQFGDLPQIPHGMDDFLNTNWDYGCAPQYKQHTVHFDHSEDIYFDGFDDGRVSMQPMQRFMIDQSPLTAGLLHANIPLHSHFEGHYAQQWPSVYDHRYTSPDRTSASGNSSYATQNEVCSPHLYHAVPYSSPDNFSRSSLSYPTTEQVFDRVPLSGTSLPGASISLRELEYEHNEVETVFENVDIVEVKQEVTHEHEQCLRKTDTTPNSFVEYADSGIGSSVRDAEEVQPIELHEDPSSDSDYSPSPTRSNKRRRSSTLSSGSGRGQKRRVQSPKEPTASHVLGSSKPIRRARRTSHSTKAHTEAHGHANERRPFHCTFAVYGCTSTFPSKNEWGRHLRTQHIKLGYWRCDLCRPTTDPNDPQAVYYNEFNRKDLFAQHLRRMHAAPSGSSRNPKEFPVTEENLPDHQKRCYMQLRTAPQQSKCLFCDRVFEGPTSWEERIEHVGRHIEKDRKNAEYMIDLTTWNRDEELEQYLCDEGLIIREKGEWMLGDGKPRRLSSVASGTDSEEE